MCPLCGSVVSASASECPGCGEQFSPVETKPGPEISEESVEGQDITEETVVEDTEELTVPADTPETDDEFETDVPEHGVCEACNGPLNEFGKCPVCQPMEKMTDASNGCPLCQSKNYSTESGDLVSCTDCGNVYVLKDFEPAGQNWKWKFWVGLIFILIGNVGVALGSYVHNVIQWSPLGSMYLGYGWMDQMVGAIGIALFIVGLFLFAWSFKREREIQCPSCKVVIRESQFDIYEPEEEEEVLPKEVAVKSALDEIGEMVECPSCGHDVSMFDTACGNCGAVFELEMDFEEQPAEESPTQEPEEPVRFLTASEIDENGIIMDSLELEKDEDITMENLELNNGDNQLDTNGLSALNELESAFEISLEEGTTCPTCGARVAKGFEVCPGCGESLKGGE